MMLLAPWLAWLAAVTSLVLLMLRTIGDDRTRWLALLWTWFAAAAYFQFYGGTGVVNALGLAAQSLLAILLLAWWKIDA